ncbi:hypothetical protein [Paracoccus sp. Ld10]
MDMMNGHMGGMMMLGCGIAGLLVLGILVVGVVWALRYLRRSKQDHAS